MAKRDLPFTRWQTAASLTTACSASLLFGFHSGVIAPALLQLKEQFGLTSWMQGFLVGALLLGAICGSPLGGRCADRWGRKPTLRLLAFLFLLGSLLSAAAGEIGILLLARFAIGVTVGMSSVVAPLYLTEIAPSERRGAYVSLNQLLITIGLLLSYGVGWLFTPLHEGWRWMLGLGALPSVLMALAVLWAMETPSWLESRAEQTGFALQSSLKESWSSLVAPPLRGLFGKAMLISALQQLTGINTIVYFAPQILEKSQWSSSGALLGTIGVGVVNVLATLLAVRLVDRAGRRPLFLWGTSGMVAGLSLLLCALWGVGASKLLLSLGLTIYIVGFAVGFGAVTWVTIGEQFAFHERAAVLGIGFLVNWSANYLVSLSFLSLVDALGFVGVFLLFDLITVGALIFLWRYLPETKGAPLKEHRH